jgi:hypothetical protein
MITLKVLRFICLALFLLIIWNLTKLMKMIESSLRVELGSLASDLTLERSIGSRLSDSSGHDNSGPVKTSRASEDLLAIGKYFNI